MCEGFIKVSFGFVKVTFSVSALTPRHLLSRYRYECVGTATLFLTLFETFQ